LFLYFTWMPRLIGSGTNARASNVPTLLGVPLVGVYGVNSVSHLTRPALVGVVKTFNSVSFASRSCAPWKARPGVPDRNVRRRQADAELVAAERRLGAGRRVHVDRDRERVAGDARFMIHTAWLCGRPGGYKLSICLPPPDVPVGTPGRAFQGAQLLDAKLTLLKRLHDADERRSRQVETLFTPYTPTKGTPTRSERSRRAFVRCRSSLGIQVKYRTRSSARTPCRQGDGGGAPVSGSRSRPSRPERDEAHEGRSPPRRARTGGYSFGRKAREEGDDLLPVEWLGHGSGLHHNGPAQAR